MIKPFAYVLEFLDSFFTLLFRYFILPVHNGHMSVTMTFSSIRVRTH